MKKSQETILGISLGMRRMGIAIGTKDGLLEKQVKGFDERYSEAKIDRLCRMVERMIAMYGVTAIALKAPDPKKRNTSLNATMASLTMLALHNNIPLMLYNITVLEKSFVSSERKSKTSLASALNHHYPELQRFYSKIESGRGLYYNRLFEAVAAMKLFLDTAEKQ